MNKYMGRLVDINAVRKAIEEEWNGCGALYRAPEIIDDTIHAVEQVEEVDAIPYQWVVDYLAWLKDIGGYGLSDARAIQSMIIKWKMEHPHSGCGPDYCELGGEG